jgi:hypothetical protein
MKKRILKSNICKQCNEYRPIYYLKDLICKRCYSKNRYYENKQRQLNRNKKFIKSRVAQGICQHCGFRPIDYQRSIKFCSFCLDKYKERSLKRVRKLKKQGICIRCGKEKIDYTISTNYCLRCRSRINYLKEKNNILLNNDLYEVNKYLEELNENTRNRTTI